MVRFVLSLRTGVEFSSTHPDQDRCAAHRNIRPARENSARFYCLIYELNLFINKCSTHNNSTVIVGGEKNVLEKKKKTVVNANANYNFYNHIYQSTKSISH